jgi:hypothetical protein
MNYGQLCRNLEGNRLNGTLPSGVGELAALNLLYVYVVFNVDSFIASVI